MKLRRGQVVRVVFYDHVSGHGKPWRCVAYGKVVGLSRRAVTIETWHGDGKQQQHISAANHEKFTIIRAAIEQIEVARQWEPVDG